MAPLATLDPDRIPVHVAWALDAADRWAGGQGLSWTEAHEAGRSALWEVVEGGLALGVKWLTVYALSVEDWQRPAGELDRVMAWFERVLTEGREELAKRGVRLCVAGRRDWRMPERLQALLAAPAERTNDDPGLTLTLAVNYGGRAEIVDAVEALAAEGVELEGIDESAIGRYLYHPDMPDPDLVVRTSGARRVSDLLLWEVAYSELVFIDVPWSEVSQEDFFRAVGEYQGRDRRYGGLDPVATR